MWAVGEIKLDHVLHVSGGSFGGLDTLEYGRMNPNREIPTICDDSLVLWESHAIVRYLAQSYGQGKLWPLNPAERAVSDQWMEWCKSHAFPAVFPLFLGTVRTEPEKRDMAAIAAKAEQAGKLLRILDDRLGEVPYIAGDAFTMGDIPLGAVIYRYLNVDVERPPLNNISTWYDRLCARPAFQQHVMNFFGTNPQEWQELERKS
jgi:glutathione S-transferase